MRAPLVITILQICNYDQCFDPVGIHQGKVSFNHWIKVSSVSKALTTPAYSEVMQRSPGFSNCSALPPLLLPTVITVSQNIYVVPLLPLPPNPPT